MSHKLLLIALTHHIRTKGCSKLTGSSFKEDSGISSFTQLLISLQKLPPWNIASESSTPPQKTTGVTEHSAKCRHGPSQSWLPILIAHRLWSEGSPMVVYCAIGFWLDKVVYGSFFMTRAMPQQTPSLPLPGLVNDVTESVALYVWHLEQYWDQLETLAAIEGLVKDFTASCSITA